MTSDTSSVDSWWVTYIYEKEINTGSADSIIKSFESRSRTNDPECGQDVPYEIRRRATGWARAASGPKKWKGTTTGASGSQSKGISGDLRYREQDI